MKKINSSQMGDNTCNDDLDSESLLVKLLHEIARFNNRFIELTEKCHMVEIENLCIKNEFKDLQNEVSILKAENMSLLQRLETIEAVGKPKVSNEAHFGSANTASADMVCMVSDVADELRAREAKAKNLVILNLPETGSQRGDVNKVKELFNDCLQLEDTHNEIMDSFRLGKERGEKPRPIKLKMSSEDHKRAVLERAKQRMKNLPNGHHFKRVFIRNDLTALERKTASERHQASIRPKTLPDKIQE